MDVNIRQWSALWGSTRDLEAALAWIPPGSETHGLWLAARPNANAEAITGLLLQARHTLAHHTSLTLDYPGGETTGAIQAAGFHPTRTLIWMEYMGATS